MFHGYLAAILGGLGVTLGIAAVSLAVACVFGLAGAVAKLSKSRAARWLAEVYTTLIRGLPELVLMLFIFYGGQILLNSVAEAQGWGYIDVPPFAAGTLTIGFIFGAYLTETFRGAILRRLRITLTTATLSLPLACAFGLARPVPQPSRSRPSRAVSGWWAGWPSCRARAWHGAWPRPTRR